MTKEDLFPITEETFPDYWYRVDALRRKARQKAAAAKIGGFLSNTVFLFVLLFFANGLLVSHTHGSYCDFLGSIPWFIQPWNRVSKVLLQPGNTLWQDGIRLFLAAYAAGIVIFAVITGLILLVYHPRKKEVPACSFRECAALLENLAKSARDLAFKTRIVTSRVAMVLTIAAGFALFFVYCFVLQDPQKITALLTRFPTIDPATNALLYVLAAYFIIDILCSILLFLTRFLYRFSFPYALLDQIATAALLSREEFAHLNAEALAEKAAALRMDALEYEKQCGYQIAKEQLYHAALLGDVPAMEHYARHCLILHLNDSAHYWLDKAAASGIAGKEVHAMRRRMQLGLRHNVEYLRASGNLTTSQKWRRAILAMCRKLISLLLTLLLAAGTVFFSAIYFAPEGTEVPLPDFLSGFFHLEGSSTAPEEERYTMTLTETGTKWEGCCIGYHQDGTPIVYSYSLSQNDDFTIPFVLPEGEKLYSSGIYTGNPWDVRKITQHVTFLENEIRIDRSFLSKRGAGECFVILTFVNAAGQTTAERYIPLILLP